MSLHADALALLRGWASPTPEQERLRERYVGHLEQHGDGVYRSCVPDHLTASTIVLSADGSRVLLTLHAKANRWFQLGGHAEASDQTLLEAAAREVREESGLDLVVDPEPVQLSEHAVPFCGATGDVHHLDVRFLAVAPEDAEHVVSEESLDVAWWPADALPEGADGSPSELVELVDLARARLLGSR